MSDDAITVQPLKNGKWRVSGVKKSFATRSEAILAAYQEAGRRKLFDADGRPVQWTEVEVPVDLLRPDGSTYGNLAAPSTGPGQRLSIEPADEKGTSG